MNKMKCFSAALVAFFLSATHLCAQDIETVSYTHLTLPTICSV